MPPTPLTHRPQTLKQAKKAYRKSGGTVCLSESEKAMLERRAVLQERADRIKEREARRKANLKRKEERVQREREARHRMGIPTPPAKEGIQVGPSQLHLSNFMYSGVKGRRDDGEEEDTKSGTQKEEETVSQEQQTSQMEPPPSRRPLQLLFPNANSQRLTPSQNAKVDPPKVRNFALQEKPASPKTAPLPSKAPPFQLKKGMREDEVLEPLRSFLLKAQATPEVYKRMRLPTLLPPLRTPPVRPVSTATINSTTHQEAPLIPAPPKSEAIPEDCFDDFFVSNTQIQRELSPPPTPPTASCTPNAFSTPRPPPPAFKPPTTDNDTADLLAFLSTQDLDFSDEPTQRPPPARHDESEPDEDFPDDELEDIVLEFELDSPVRSSNATNPDEHQPKPPLVTQSDADKYNNGDAGSHHDSSSSADDAELQTSLQAVFRDYEKETQRQEAQRAAAAYDDAFDLSTQDLMELET